jgi:inward rectifier potassium channel
MAQRRETQHFDGYDIHVVGGPAPGLRDLYHGLLRIPWWAALLVIVVGYLLLNGLFALVYLAVGGVANAEPGSVVDMFFFSVQTMGTIGYGAMYPATRAASAVVVGESVVGLVVTALATGLVFARFSQTRARVTFSSRPAISPIDGVPTLTVRVGNERRGAIIDVAIRATLMKTARTEEGVLVYRSHALSLVRDRVTTLSRSWMIQHRIEAGSPLFGETPASLAASEAELTIIVAGTDDTSMQPVHALCTWTAAAFAWGARLADVLSETPTGDLLLDLAKFHRLEPTAPTAAFPHSFEPTEKG